MQQVWECQLGPQVGSGHLHTRSPAHPLTLTCPLPRSTCNVCNGPQFNTEEERTGLGGGFDERGTVEYKERTEDSDPEYDDLGRRKKRKLPPGYKRPEPPRMPTPEPEEEEEEEEEDDEDDDGDLSKYDLWGGDDDADKKDGKEEEKNGKNDEGKKDDPKDVVKRKKSRSRSRSRSSTKDKKRSRRSRSSRFTLLLLDSHPP